MAGWQSVDSAPLLPCGWTHNRYAVDPIHMPAPIKVAIVEDDTRLRESLSIVVSGAEGFVCTGSYGSGETAFKQIPLDRPEVVLMDINLPQMSGIECVAKLKEICPQLHVIMLTVYVDAEKIFQSLQAGASGYLIKQTRPAEILEAITDVQRGGAPMSHMIAKKVVEYFQNRKSSTEAENLTRREHEILTLLAKGCQDKEIAGMLSLSFFTVRGYIKNIYEKLHVRSRAEAVAKFLGSR
jgi:DNA-binding NarL/FixJ family response regulator